MLRKKQVIENVTAWSPSIPTSAKKKTKSCSRNPTPEMLTGNEISMLTMTMIAQKTSSGGSGRRCIARSTQYPSSVLHTCDGSDTASATRFTRHARARHS
jgi:hypothetical protein